MTLRQGMFKTASESLTRRMMWKLHEGSAKRYFNFLVSSSKGAADASVGYCEVLKGALLEGTHNLCMVVE